MRIKKLPYLSLLLSLVMLIAALKGHHHDQQQWQSIQKTYHDSIFALEAPIYLDYLKRKLNVHGIGNIQHINTLADAIEENKTLPVIKAMLKDIEFTQYMHKSGSSFLQKQTFILWQEHRNQIEPYFFSTVAQRLGLSSQHFQAKQMITHLVSHPLNSMFLLVFISFVVTSTCFEKHLGAFRLYAYIVVSSLVSALAYVSLSSSNSPVLATPLAILYGLQSSFGTYLLYHHKRHNESTKLSKVTLSLACLSILSTVTYTVLVLGALTNPLLMFLSSVLFPVLIGILFMLTSLKISSSEPANGTSTSLGTLDWPYRAEYSKALDFLSRFEFNAARQTLNTLSTQYPESATVLEQRYHLAKFQPEDTHYWKLAKDLIELCIRTNDYSRVCRLFADIQKNAATKNRAQEKLEPEHYHKIMALFVTHGDLPKAEQAFHFLELGGDKHIIQDACLMLIQEYKVRRTYAKQQQYEMLLERLKG